MIECLVSDRRAAPSTQAAERVFLYLRCLNFPSVDALELARRAVIRAEQRANGDFRQNQFLLAEAMEALGEMLMEQKQKPSAPPMRRLHMTARELGPVGLRAAFEFFNSILFGRPKKI